MTRPDTRDPWGRDDLMATAAVRYCLGRSSYIVGDCVDWLLRYWDAFAPNTREVIRRDIDAAFVRDDKARAERAEHKPLGMDMDRAEWERVRSLWTKT